MGRFPQLLLVLFFGTLLHAQEQPHVTQMDLSQQISVGAGAVITRKTTVNGVKFEPTSAGAYEASYRYRILRHLSAQVDYDFFMNAQKYLASGQQTAIRSQVHVLTGSAVFTFGTPFSKRMESFISVGGGALVYVPRDANGLAKQTINQFSIGGGDDFLLTHKVRIRAEVKGLTYKAPDFGFASIRTNKYVNTVIPTLGVVYSF